LGHCGTHLKSNKAAFQALGIVDGKLLKSLHLDLSVLAADNLQITCERVEHLLTDFEKLLLVELVDVVLVVLSTPSG